MCHGSKKCFEKEEIFKLKKLGWTKKQIDFVENSITEKKIKELIRKS